MQEEKDLSSILSSVLELAEFYKKLSDEYVSLYMITVNLDTRITEVSREISVMKFDKKFVEKRKSKRGRPRKQK